MQILMVEDNAGDVILMQQILAELAPQIKVVTALDGDQALQILADAQFSPAFILLDLNLPRVSGYEVLQRNPRKETPIIVFSGSFNRADQARAYELGAQEYLQKPTNLEGYRSVVAGIVERWAVK